MNEGAVQLSETKPLPDGWRWVNLGQVCDEAKTRDPRLSPDMPFRYIDISSICATRKQIIGTHTILGRDAPSRARQVVKANDVLVATTRPNLNAVALVPAELDDEICSTGFCVLRPANEIDPLFLFYFVQTNDFVRLVSGEVRGMLYPAVTDNHVHAINIPLPPLPEQKRIAAKIQELMAEIQRARTACEAQLEAARILPHAYLRQVFESDEAKKWERRRLGEVCQFSRYGLTATSTNDSRGFPYLRITDIDDSGSIKIDAIKFVDCDENTYKNYALEEGEILFARSGSIGRTFLYSGIPQKAVFASYLIKFRLKREIIEPSYLFYFTHSPIYYNFIEEKKHTLSQPNINAKEYGELLIPFPLLSEQRHIAAELKDKMVEAEKLKAAIEKQLETIRALPQAILRKAFRGEL
jgi:type I restriction enzyme S subunit